MMISYQNLVSVELPSGIEVTHDNLLGKQVQIVQPKTGYRVGSDAILIAASLPAQVGKILDLGAGVGGISLCIAKRLESSQIMAIEIDRTTADLARYNAVLNGVSQRVKVVCGDIASMPSDMAGSFDHVVSNPPYHHSDGTKSQNRARRVAHMGADTSLRDWVNAAVWAAKPRGRVSFICRADRLVELFVLFESFGASEAIVFPIWPRSGAPASRLIIEIRKGVTGPTAILPGLVVHNEDGSFTTKAKRIMKGGSLSLVHPARKK